MYEFGFGFSYFGLFGAPGRVCTALVEDLVLTSKYWNLFIFTVIVPLHHYTISTPCSTSRHYVFNYSKMSKDIYINTSVPTSCTCSNSRYIVCPISHIITGDLSIVQDLELISFLKKGHKYRPPANTIWKDCRNIIYEALNKYCKKWIKRERADP